MAPDPRDSNNRNRDTINRVATPATSFHVGRRIHFSVTSWKGVLAGRERERERERESCPVRRTLKGRQCNAGEEVDTIILTTKSGRGISGRCVLELPISFSPCAAEVQQTPYFFNHLQLSLQVCQRNKNKDRVDPYSRCKWRVRVAVALSSHLSSQHSMIGGLLVVPPSNHCISSGGIAIGIITPYSFQVHWNARKPEEKETGEQHTHIKGRKRAGVDCLSLKKTTRPKGGEHMRE